MPETTDYPYTFRIAVPSDREDLLALLPELADFNVPERRNREDLWRSDFQLVQDIWAGNAPSSFVDVAVDANDVPKGIILVTLREELLSHAPSAHLEAIVVAPDARGRGLGRILLARAEEKVRAQGARSLTLHVFANNVRARALYDAEGFDSELIRAIKWLDD